MTGSRLKATRASPAIEKRFLVIGCGSIGRRHIGNLKHLGAQDILAYDIREDRRQEITNKLGVRVFSDLNNALAVGPDAVLVCSPPSFHIEHAMASAKAGADLFVEKPLSNSLDHVDALLKEVKRRKLMALVGCNFRFHPGLRWVKALLDQGAIGAVTSARAQFGQYLPDWHPWEDYRQSYSAKGALGGGVVLDRVHEIDYMRWLLGEITEVSAITDHTSRLETETEDTAEILLRFRGGPVGSIHLDYVRRTYSCRLEIVGESGTILWSYEDRNVRWYLADERRWHSIKWPSYDDNEMYLAELEHFLRVLEGQETAELDLAGGERVLAIALAAKESSRQKRVVTP